MSNEILKALTPVGPQARIVDPGPITSGTALGADLSAYIGRMVVIEAVGGDLFFFCGPNAAGTTDPEITASHEDRGRRIPSGQEREFKITSERCYFKFDTDTSNAEAAIYESSL